MTAFYSCDFPTFQFGQTYSSVITPGHDTEGEVMTKLVCSVQATPTRYLRWTQVNFEVSNYYRVATRENGELNLERRELVLLDSMWVDVHLCVISFRAFRARTCIDIDLDTKCKVVWWHQHNFITCMWNRGQRCHRDQRKCALQVS